MISFFLPAFALPCEPDDRACEQANAIRDGLELLAGEPLITDDHRKARRRTQLIHDRLVAIHEAAAASACTIEGVDYAVSIQGVYEGEFHDDTGLGGTITGQVDGWNLDGTCAVAGADDDPCGAGMWGRTHSGSGKLGALRDAQGFVIGGFTRITGSMAVAWGVHGVCPQRISAAFSPYMPQLAGLEDHDPRPATP